MNTTFSGEVRFKSYADSSSAGARVTFTLDDRKHLSEFVGLEGKRYMLAIVEIGDDEQPVQQPVEKPEKEPIGDLCHWAVLRCREGLFYQFIAPIYDKFMGGAGLGHGDLDINDMKKEEFCKHAVLVLSGCNSSRKELDTDARAAQNFKERIMRPYQRYYLAAGGARAGL